MHQTNKLIKNWAKNVQFEVTNFYQPTDETEIISIIKKHEKIRIVGSGHSWSEVIQTKEALINLDLYNKVLEINEKDNFITVQAGIKLKNLNEVLAQAGLAMINLGSIDKQSLAGAISTGTHGTGIQYQILASQMLSFSLIKANGEKIKIHKIHDAELFHAAVVNIGALGIISEICLQVTKAFQLQEQTATYDFDEIIENIDEFIQKNDHFKLWWLPPNKKVVVFRYQRTSEKPNDSKLRQFLKDKVLSVYIYRSLVFFAKIFPSLSRTINSILMWDMRNPLNRIEKSHKVFIVPEPPIHRETEWAFDINRTKEILKNYKQMILEKGFKLNFIQEIRFTKADEFWLSPCYKRDSLWLGLYAYDHENWETLLPFFESFAKEHDGRPHWGKEASFEKDYLSRQYEKFNDFVGLKKSIDPESKFENEYIKNIFNQ